MGSVQLLAAKPLPAQVPDWVGPGHRLRITVNPSGTTLAGTVIRRVADSLVLETATGELRLGPGSIGRLEVSRAIRSKAFVGAVIGMAVGVVAGVVAGLSAHNDPDASAVVGGLFLGAIGAPVGALVGAGKHYDVWTQLYPAPPRRPIASATAGGSRIVLSFHLPLPR